MALLKIARLGHPVLLGRAAEVADATAPDIQHLIADMAETMADARGIGLAAPQVHVSLRLFLFRDGPDGETRVLINPDITPLGEDLETAWEACLSIPGLRGPAERPARVRFRGLDQTGAAIEGEAAGLLARVMQHENDHLDGKFYLSRMPDPSLLAFAEELARYPKETA